MMKKLAAAFLCCFFTIPLFAWDGFLKIGFEKENILCLTSDSRSKNRPTKENIEESLTMITEKAEEGDTIFLAMSGRGFVVNGQSRFCPINTRVEGISEAIETTVGIDEIFEALNKCEATFKLILIDACRNQLSPSEAR